MEIHIRINSNKGAPAKSKVKLLAGMVMVSLCSVKVYLTRDPHSVFERQFVCFCGRQYDGNGDCFWFFCCIWLNCGHDLGDSK